MLFPIIETIDDVLPHIVDCPEIRVMDKGDYTVTDYMISNKDVFPDIVDDLNAFLSTLAHSKDTEGVVLHTGSDFVKVKTEWYCNLHRAKSDLLSEYRFVRMVHEGKTDDLKPHLTDTDRARVEQFENEYAAALQTTCDDLFVMLRLYKKKYADRKAFALEEAPRLDKVWAGLFFRFWDHKELERDMFREEVNRTILKHLTCGKSLEKIRFLFGNLKWDVNGKDADQILEE